MVQVIKAWCKCKGRIQIQMQLITYVKLSSNHGAKDVSKSVAAYHIREVIIKPRCKGRIQIQMQLITYVKLSSNHGAKDVSKSSCSLSHTWSYHQITGRTRWSQLKKHYVSFKKCRYCRLVRLAVRVKAREVGYSTITYRGRYKPHKKHRRWYK
jgi:hypothetical protein